MPVVFVSKWLVLVFAVFTVPMGVVEYLEYRHAQGAKHAPLVEGEVVLARIVQRWDRPVQVYTLRIVGTETEVRAEDVRGDLLPRGERVRFHYTGDPAREVRLERERSPLSMVAFLWGAPIFMVLLYLALSGAVLGRRRSEAIERGPEFWSGRRELRPGTWSNSFLSLCGLGVAGLGAVGIANPEISWFTGGILVVVGVVGSVVMALSALPRFSGITLRDDGFEVRELGRRTQVAWDQVLAFGIQEGVHSDRNVVCQRQAPDGGSETLTLPGIRRMTPDDLLLLMVQWWTHFGPEPQDEYDFE